MGIPEGAQPAPLQELAAVLPSAAMVKVPPELLAVAVDTFDALVVYEGGGPPLPCPLVGIVHVAKVVGVVQEEGGEGWELTTNVSEAELPVLVVSMNKFPVVLLYVPGMKEPTVTIIVQVPFPAIVIFEKDIGVLTVDGEGELPHPL